VVSIQVLVLVDEAGDGVAMTMEENLI